MALVGRKKKNWLLAFGDPARGAEKQLRKLRRRPPLKERRKFAKQSFEVLLRSMLIKKKKSLLISQKFGLFHFILYWTAECSRVSALITEFNSEAEREVPLGTSRSVRKLPNGMRINFIYSLWGPNPKWRRATLRSRGGAHVGFGSP